jgi:hypothetical protein
MLVPLRGDAHKRPLPLIALMLLAAAPLSAQTLQPGWIADTKTGCRVWNTFPLPGESISWTGLCRNDLAQGRGVLQWFKGDKPTARYDGELRNGKMNGRGYYTWPDGDSYKGEYRDDLRNGRGVYTWASGNRYEGEWRDGAANGWGVKTWVGGNRYEGEWRDDKANGSGTYTSSGSGRAHFGVWTNGCFRQGDVWFTAGATARECGFE